VLPAAAGSTAAAAAAARVKVETELPDTVDCRCVRREPDRPAFPPRGGRRSLGGGKDEAESEQPLIADEMPPPWLELLPAHVAAALRRVLTAESADAPR
jgi:hypothetical protein